MELDDLKVLIQLSDHGSIRGVAQKLDVSRSALRRQLERLEQAFGTPLVMREGRGVQLTAAGAHAVARADEDQFIHLTGPEQPLAPTGRLSVIGPGTGLGVAHLYREPTGEYRVSATEGGHIDFAPLDQIEDAILARLRKRHNRVSVERVVAGPAIVDIYQTLAAIERKAVPDCDDIEIWTKAASGEDSLASAAVDRFCLSLGSVAGDIALAQGGFGGVVIAGGLGYRIRETLQTSGFAERFTAKGRFQALMSTIPVKLIIHPQPGLFGAAAAFATQYTGQNSPTYSGDSK